MDLTDHKVQCRFLLRWQAIAYNWCVFELRHLRVLAEVARTGSYSAAARTLGYTQPAVSQQMHALERAVGAKLAIRAGRTMRLTETGEILTRHATAILMSAKAAEEEVAAVTGLRAGRVRITAFPSGSATLVPSAIAHAVRLHPGIRVSLFEAEPPESLDALRAGDCDIALIFTYEGSDEQVDRGGDVHLHQTSLLDEPLLAVLPTAHRLSSASWIRLDDLADDDWIAGCPRCRRNLVHVCERVGFEPRITFATDDNAASGSLVAAGLGVALMPRLVLATIRQDGIVVKPVVPALTRRIIAVTWRDLRRVPTIGAVLDALISAAIDAQSVGGSAEIIHA